MQNAFNNTHRHILQQSLFGEGNPEALSYIECHGFLCAIASGPVVLDSESTVRWILTGNKDDPYQASKELTEAITLLYKDIESTLFNGNTLVLPCSLHLDNGAIDDSLNEWAYGFFEAYMIDEDSWYGKNEEQVAEMLLPILLAVEELDDPELSDIRKQQPLLDKLVKEIPFALQDIYLFFNSEK